MLEQLLVSTLVSEFLIERQSRNMSLKTIKLYTVELKYFSNWLENNGYSNLNLKSLSPVILRKWFQSRNSHRNKGGIHCNYRIIITFLNWVNFEYELSDWKNPIKKVFIELNKTLPLPEIPITDVNRLLGVCNLGRNSLRDKAILKLLIDSAARGAELLSLNISDVDLKTGNVTIQCGKGSRPRVVYLGDKSLKTIKEYLINRNDDNPALFINEEGERLKFFGLRMLITRLCKRAKIKIWGIHCFRRTSALTIYRKTKDIFL